VFEFGQILERFLKYVHIATLAYITLPIVCYGYFTLKLYAHYLSQYLVETEYLISKQVNLLHWNLH
jgi:branched-subunit amino acid transport protein